jgi:hypothetical protein
MLNNTDMKFEDEVFNEYIVLHSTDIINMISEFMTHMLKRQFEYVETGGRCYFTGLPGITKYDRLDLESSSQLIVNKTKHAVVMSVVITDPVKFEEVLGRYGVTTIDQFIELAVYKYLPTGLTLSLVALKYLIGIIRTNHPLLEIELIKKRIVDGMSNN